MPKWPEEGVSEEYLSELIDFLLVRDAKNWLDNRGVPFKGNNAKRNVSHASDIPIDLIERCVQASPDLRVQLGFETEEEAADENNEVDDLRALYEALCERSYEKCVIPVRINPKTGLGLFIFGPKFAKEDNKEVVNRAFSKYLNGKGYNTFCDIQVPFFVIMHHRWYRQENEQGTAGSNSVHSFWGDVVEAWIPNGIILGKEEVEAETLVSVRFPGDVVEAWIPDDDRFAKDALARFRNETYYIDSLYEYRIYNPGIGNFPGCPDRYQCYFLDDDF